MFLENSQDQTAGFFDKIGFVSIVVVVRALRIVERECRAQSDTCVNGGSARTMTDCLDGDKSVMDPLRFLQPATVTGFRCALLLYANILYDSMHI